MGVSRFFPDYYGRDPRPLNARSDEDRCGLHWSCPGYRPGTSTAAPVSRPDLSRSSAIFASSSANVSVTVRMGACSATSKKDRPSSRVRLATETRSEEHTSELQSLMRISYAVFCLKKNKKQTPQTDQNRQYNDIKK